MSIQLVLLKSGEEVIADVKEFRDEVKKFIFDADGTFTPIEDQELISYLFKDPYKIKIKQTQVLVEGKNTPKREAILYRWMPLSKDSDIIVNKDWIVCITDPIDTIKTSYEERLNERRRSNDSNKSGDGRDGGASGSNNEGSVESNSNSFLSESTDNNNGD